MSSAAEAERFKELYDVERHVMATDGGILATIAATATVSPARVTVRGLAPTSNPLVKLFVRRRKRRKVHH